MYGEEEELKATRRRAGFKPAETLIDEASVEIRAKPSDFTRNIKQPLYWSADSYTPVGTARDVITLRVHPDLEDINENGTWDGTMTTFEGLEYEWRQQGLGFFVIVKDGLFKPLIP